MEKKSGMCQCHTWQICGRKSTVECSYLTEYTPSSFPLKDGNEEEIRNVPVLYLANLWKIKEMLDANNDMEKGQLGINTCVHIYMYLWFPIGVHRLIWHEGMPQDGSKLEVTREVDPLRQHFNCAMSQAQIHQATHACFRLLTHTQTFTLGSINIGKSIWSRPGDGSKFVLQQISIQENTYTAHVHILYTGVRRLGCLFVDFKPNIWIIWSIRCNICNWKLRAHL